MRSIFILLLAALCSQATASQRAKNIPVAAKNAFLKSYAGATKVKWDKEGDQYEATFSYQQKKMSVLYSAAGAVMETETRIALAELPMAAQKYASAKGKVKESAKIVMADGSVQYEAEVGGKDLLFDEKGIFIGEHLENH